MREVRSLINAHPRAGALDPPYRRDFVAVELAFAFMTEHIPDTPVEQFPSLLQGYPLICERGPEIAARVNSALAVLKHACAKLVTRGAWRQAVAQYRLVDEPNRCYRVDGKKVVPREAAPEDSLRFLESALANPLPRIATNLREAGSPRVRAKIDEGKEEVFLDVPTLSIASDGTVPRHEFKERPISPPIKISMHELHEAASAVDRLESQPDWCDDALPPLRLHKRLKGIETKDVRGAFSNGEIRIEGATHLVGMLSSGKSTMVLAILFALARRNPPRRVLLLVQSTIQGAQLTARLRRHGIPVSLISSLAERDRHLQSALRVGRSAGASIGGRGIQTVGVFADEFNAGCPLNGAQRTDRPEPAKQDKPLATPRLPRFKDRPCHRLYEDGSDSAKSCPLWSRCQAQEPHRDAVGATVIVMTPQAFIHTRPEPQTTEWRTSFPELVQFAADLVIIDEADEIQRTFDSEFAPRVDVVSRSRDAFVTNITQRFGQTLQESSGGVVASPFVNDWTVQYMNFNQSVVRIYGLLENERGPLARYRDRESFTAESILLELARARLENNSLGSQREMPGHESPESLFSGVLSCASAIREAAIGDSSDALVGDDAFGRDESMRLRQLAEQAVANIATPDDLIEAAETDLAGRLALLNPANIRGKESDVRDNAVAITLAIYTGISLALYAWLMRSWPGIEDVFGLGQTVGYGKYRRLLQNYGPLLPGNPAGAALGFVYGPEEDGGGKLELINHAAVGRVLMTHMHALVSAEGQAGPHTLLLSGTSWAGGPPRRDEKNNLCRDHASQVYDVQVPVAGVLKQPDAEVDAIASSVFELVDLSDDLGRQPRISGSHPDRERPAELEKVARRLAIPHSDGLNVIEKNWARMAHRWREGTMRDRQRALLLTNSYADAEVIAARITAELASLQHKDRGWSVSLLVQDGSVGDNVGPSGTGGRDVQRLERSRVESFGRVPEPAILVAPIWVVSRGHNILSPETDKAAISSIYFIHRFHHPPGDMSRVIAAINRLGQDIVDNGVPGCAEEASLRQKARALSRQGKIVRGKSLAAVRSGYALMTDEAQAQFAWDSIALIWQAVGRGIRGGAPVYAGFVDAAFAPRTFAAGESKETSRTSVLLRCIECLKSCIEDTEVSDPRSELAKILYAPFYEALKNVFPSDFDDVRSSP